MTPSKTQTDKTLNLICDECGESITIDLAVTVTILPQCQCGSRRFTVNPTEH